MHRQALVTSAPDNSAPEPVLVAMDRHGVATVTMNRPERHNAFDDHAIERLTARFKDLAANRSVRVVILTGAGPSFSSGADLGWMRSMANYTREENRADADRLADMLATLAALPQPTLARVNGAAFGGGVGLVCCCDLAIASNRAKFALTEVRLGLAPAVISPYVIRTIGARQCQRYFQTGEVIAAREAQRLGLVHEAVEPDYLDTAVERQVRLLLKGGPHAQSAIKRLVGDVRDARSSETLFELTSEVIARLRVSPEGQEGLSAFLEKRTPTFELQR